METPARRGVQRALDLLAPLGLLIVVAAVAWQRTLTRPLPGQPRWYYIAGAALVLLHLTLRWDDIAQGIGQRQMRYGSNTVAITLGVLALLGGLNYVANNRDKSWDLTKNQRHSLSEQTRHVVASLKEDVTLTYFERGDRLGEARERLERFHALSPRIKVSFVDPIVNPGPARDYEVTAMPTLVVERGPRREKISSDGEQDITNAIIKVTRDSKKTVCFVEGEGERDPDDTSQRGFGGAKAALAKSQYETRKVFLARQGAVPAECTVLVVAGPEKDYFPSAVEAIRAFVKGGGKALLLLEPDMRGSTPALVALAAEWNVVVGRDVIIDRSSVGQMVGGGPLTPVVLSYPFHEITKDLREVMTVFHTARSVQAGTAAATGVVAQNLAETFEASWAETDLSLKGGEVNFDAAQDKRGPVSLAAVATLSGAALAPAGAPTPAPSASPAFTLEGPVIASPGAGPPPTTAPSASPTAGATPSPSPEAGAPSPSPSPDESKREARVVVYGDSDFASNALLGAQGNQDLFMNTVAWLAQDPDLISIRAREPDDQRLFLTQQQQGNVFLVSHLLLPGAFLALGVAAWWRRRG